MNRHFVVACLVLCSTAEFTYRGSDIIRKRTVTTIIRELSGKLHAGLSL
jgi:hypothetical protein